MKSYLVYGLFAVTITVAAVLLLKDPGTKGRELIISNSSDNRISVVTTLEGDENSLEAIYHIYLRSNATGAKPDEIAWVTRSNQAYARWGNDDTVELVVDGGEVHYTRASDVPVPVQAGDRIRQIAILLIFTRS
ncbi:hypothetical protein FHS83_000976 [Rhizomicrobium palustre]|uniref:Uncharacterized protein n=1 Tax=Rhizomicrobium palustre TaxID=189966 RepID=A0A846MVS3_9PROT|nr:hypothetical protein [Rhizomicrobium palustre]NIK87658.1 hypothetical protein [Rhizomicrobium palustre]